jgi:mercuric ion transport protein
LSAAAELEQEVDAVEPVKEPRKETSKKGIYFVLAGTAAVAVCCFAPILVAALGAVGLSALTPYLGYVLLFVLALLVLVAVLSYRRWRSGSVHGG